MDNEEKTSSPNASSDSGEKLPGTKKKLLWSLVSVVIAVLTVWAVMSQGNSFSLADFWAQIQSASKGWIVSAVVSMICYICFEAAAILCILREFGYKMSFRKGFVYSSADIYFSAITPSATGGQPASAYFMHLDGIPTTLAAVVLLANLLMYSCSTVGMGILSTAVAPLTITRFSTFSKVLIILGFIIQIALLILIFLIITKEKIILTLGNGIISFLGKIKIIRHTDAKKEKFSRSVDDYKQHASVVKGRRKMMGKVLIFNLLQRISQILVTVFTYLALGNPLHALRAFSLQTYISIGAYCIPIPGSMGITDYLMIDGFSRIEDVPLVMNESRTLSFELLSRTLSFYSCILICGITVLVTYLIRRNRRNSKK
jgi:hypothetical protein